MLYSLRAIRKDITTNYTLRGHALKIDVESFLLFKGPNNRNANDVRRGQFSAHAHSHSTQEWEANKTKHPNKGHTLNNGQRPMHQSVRYSETPQYNLYREDAYEY